MQGLVIDHLPCLPLSSDTAVNGAKQTHTYTCTELRSNWTGSSNSNRIILPDSPAQLHFSALIGLTVFIRACALFSIQQYFFCCSLWLRSPLSFLVFPSPPPSLSAEKYPFVLFKQFRVFLPHFFLLNGQPDFMPPNVSISLCQCCCNPPRITRKGKNVLGKSVAPVQM